MMNQLLTFAASDQPHVSIKAETVFEVAGFPITNSILLGLLGFVVVLWLFWHTADVIKNNKKRTFIAKFVEWIYEALYNTVKNIVVDEKMAKKLAPLPITLFFFILIQYYLGVLPIVGSISFNGIPMFRPYVADLNATFSLAIVTIIAVEVYAFKVHGIFDGLGRYFKNPIKDFPGAFEGILEIIAQMSRGIALSMRLFGNIFAGEVLLIMIAFLASYAASAVLPIFYLFEIFMGAIQAYIFFMLTTIFISLGMATHGSHDTVQDPAHPPVENLTPVTDRG